MFTGALIMQLVDAGEVELDTPVVTYAHRFAVRDESATANATIRHLLTHTGGELRPYVGSYTRPFSDVGFGWLAGRLVAQVTFKQGFPRAEEVPPSPPPMSLALCVYPAARGNRAERCRGARYCAGVTP
jgi:hypothetical protein